MSESRRPGMLGLERLGWQIVPSRTPGSLGVNDAADPNRQAWQGDTPGSLGMNDHAGQQSPRQQRSLNNVQDDSQLELAHALKLVEDLIAAGNSFGAPTAAELMQFWRDGGDDRLGEQRLDEQWTNLFGTVLSGKRLPSSLFWPGHRSSVAAILAQPRESFIQGAQARLKDGRLGPPQWQVEMVKETASGNWRPGDLQVALGPCTLDSRVRVRVSKLTRSGTVVDLQNPQNRPQLGDEATCDFIFWEVCLRDRYDWIHGRSGNPGWMGGMNLVHLYKYHRWENPQEILHRLETPYGFLNPDFPRVLARPFWVETERVVLRNESSPSLDLQTFGTQETAVLFAAPMRSFVVKV